MRFSSRPVLVPIGDRAPEPHALAPHVVQRGDPYWPHGTPRQIRPSTSAFYSQVVMEEIGQRGFLACERPVALVKFKIAVFHV
jgi:hypothetical protein